MNKVILIGNLTRDPELKTTSTNIPVCTFGIAVNRPFANANGEREVDFFNITVWRAAGENCYRFLKKGSKVGIVGVLQTRSYDDKEGIKRHVTEIVADEVEFLTPKGSQDSAPAPGGAPAQGNQPVRKTIKDNDPIDDDHLPF